MIFVVKNTRLYNLKLKYILPEANRANENGEHKNRQDVANVLPNHQPRWVLFCHRLGHDFSNQCKGSKSVTIAGCGVLTDHNCCAELSIPRTFHTN